MRELKIRAWDKFDAKIVSWEELIKDAPSEHVLIDVIRNPARYEAMQFIGLKDKNGKEIYEGDVLLDLDAEMQGYVYWDEYRMRAKWKYANPRQDQRSDFFIDGNVTDEFNRFEVIGTVYDPSY